MVRCLKATFTPTPLRFAEFYLTLPGYMLNLRKPRKNVGNQEKCVCGFLVAVEFCRESIKRQSIFNFYACICFSLALLICVTTMLNRFLEQQVYGVKDDENLQISVALCGFLIYGCF